MSLGRLVSARATGTLVNEQPEIEMVLDVETADGSIMRGTASTFVNQGELAGLAPGTALSVRYLPNGRMALDLDPDLVAVEHAVYESRLARGVLTPQQVDVARNGQDAVAVVTAMQPTGEVVDGMAVLRIELTVTRSDGTQFAAVRQMPTPAGAVSGLQAGNVVQVRYLPHDESYVGINVGAA